MNAGISPADEDTISQEVLEQRVRIMYASVLPSVIANLAIALVVMIVFEVHGPEHSWFGANFLGAIVAIGILRIVNLSAWKARPPGDSRHGYWKARYLLTLGLNALIWVALAVELLFVDEMALWVFGLIVLLGNSSGALINVASQRVFYIYSGPQLAALIVILWIDSRFTDGPYLAVLVMVFAGYLAAMARSLNLIINRSFRDRLEKDLLERSVERERDEKNRAVRQVESEIHQYLLSEQRAKSLDDRLQQHHVEAEYFESLLVDIALRLGMASVRDLGVGVNSLLETLGKAFAFDCVALSELGSNPGAGTSGSRSASSMWHNENVNWTADAAEIRDRFPTILGMADVSGIVQLDDIETLAEIAPLEHQSLRDANIQSLLVISLGHPNECRGVISVASTALYKEFSDTLIRRVRAVGLVLLAAVMRREARQNIEEAGQLYQAVFNQFLFGVALVGAKGRLERFNDRFREVFQLRSDTDRAVHFDDVLTSMNDVEQLAFRLDWELLKSHQRTHLKRDIELVGERSELKIVNVAMFPVESEQSAFPLIAIIAQDVTKARELSRDVEQMTRERERNQRVMMMGELSVSIAHELNQPLTAIVSNAEYLLARQSLEATPEATTKQQDEAASYVTEVCNDVIADAMRAGDIIQRVRAMTRGESLVLDSLNLNDVVHNALRLMHSEVVIRRASVKLQLADSLFEIRGDAVQLEQVIVNLLMNALESVAKTAERLVAISIRTRNIGQDKIELSVEDNGRGLSKDIQAHLFDAFASHKEGGMGMGLAIVRGIVERHGGTISADNLPVSGARFRMVLPRQQREVELCDFGDGSQP